jgi:NADH:ubiquinone oxidoreductase subunit E
MDAPARDSVDLSPMNGILAQYQGQPGALIPILQQTQNIYGYLPIEAMQHIADGLGITLGKIYSVATFYAQFYLERRGKHLLRLCDGTACHVRGTPLLLTAVEDKFHIGPGETTTDGELTVELVYCVGSCALAPVAVLDGQVMGRLRQETLMRQVKRFGRS